MEYQEIKNLLENIPNKPSLFKKKMNHEERITKIIKLDSKLKC